MEFIKKIVLTVSLFLTTLMCNAEATESRDLFFRSGKYNVVVAVLVILFIILFVYLFRLDRKVSNLEKDHREK
mgnify:CR=1 FL=1